MGDLMVRRRVVLGRKMEYLLFSEGILGVQPLPELDENERYFPVIPRQFDPLQIAQRFPERVLDVHGAEQLILCVLPLFLLLHLCPQQLVEPLLDPRFMHFVFGLVRFERARRERLELDAPQRGIAQFEGVGFVLSVLDRLGMLDRVGPSSWVHFGQNEGPRFHLLWAWWYRAM